MDKLTGAKKRKLFKLKSTPKIMASKFRKRKDIVNLYLFNPTIRNPRRLIDFLMLTEQFVKTWGYGKPIYEQQILDFVRTLLVKKEEDDENKIFKIEEEELTFSAILKKLSELQGLGFISFVKKTELINENDKVKKSYIVFSQTEYPIETFNQFRTDEQLSSFYLFILKREGVLELISDIIIHIDHLWSKSNGKRKGISIEEIIYIYRIFPHLIKTKIRTSIEIVKFLINTRNEYKEYHQSLPKKERINYKTYLIQIADDLKIKNKTIQKYDTCRDYVDVLFRTLTASNCFVSNTKGNCKYLHLNEFFISKLFYFYITTFKNLTQLILTNTLEETLNEFEIKFFKNEFKEIILEPAVFRIERTKRKKATIYTEYDNLDEITEIKELDKIATQSWSDFEHINNWLLCYHIKKNIKNVKLKENNIQHAIKFDYSGNHLMATTPGISDMLVKLPKLNVIVESSLRYDYNLRVNEFVQVISHAEDIAKNEPEKPLLVFMVVNKLNQDFVFDFKDKNNGLAKTPRGGKYRKIVYIPIEYDDYKKLMLTSNKNDLLYTLYEKTRHFFIKLNDLEETFKFNDLNLF